MAPRSTLDASKLVLTTGAGCLVFARAHLGFVPWEFVPSVFSAFGSSIWGTSTGRSSTLTDLAFCTRTVLTTRTTRSATGQSTSGRCQSCRSCWEVVSWYCGAPAVSRPASASRSGWFSLTHLLHHVGGSRSFPTGCSFENGLVTRFLSA